jgi:PAS domain S-box-containing protein
VYPMPVDNDASREGAVGSSEEFIISRTKFEWLQLLAAIVESSDDAIITKTIEGVVTSWNRGAERVFGYPAQEMLGQSIFRLACVGGENDMVAVLDQIRRGERVDHYETMRRRKDGTEIAVSLTVSPIRSSSGEIVGASKIARDISVRKQTEKAMRIAENLAAVGRLASSIAHDINNPLAAATNLLFLLENEDLSEEGKHYLATAQRELSRIAHITAQALGFYRSREELVWLSIATILDDALVLHHDSCSALGIEVSRDYDSAPQIFCRPGELRQVMVNLVGNALDAMPSGGRLQLRIRRTTDWIKGGRALRIAQRLTQYRRCSHANKVALFEAMSSSTRICVSFCQCRLISKPGIKNRGAQSPLRSAASSCARPLFSRYGLKRSTTLEKAFVLEPSRSVNLLRILGPATCASSRMYATISFFRKMLFGLKDDPLRGRPQFGLFAELSGEGCCGVFTDRLPLARIALIPVDVVGTLGVFFFLAVNDHGSRLDPAIARHHDRAVAEAFRRTDAFGEIDPEIHGQKSTKPVLLLVSPVVSY